MEDKASKRALEAYPKETRDIDGIVIDIGHPQYMRDLFIEGYNQAEKDLELTVDDIMKIDALLIEMWNKPSNEDKYQEILKRFKEEMKEK